MNDRSVIVKGEEIVLTAETIIKTREYFAQIERECIEEASAGKWHVNNLHSYTEYCRQRAKESLAGMNDHTLTFIQRALWIQTGECVPLLS